MTAAEQVTKLRKIQEKLATCLIGEDGHVVPGYAEIETAMREIGVAATKTLVSQADY